jgi:hypothetical protein
MISKDEILMGRDKQYPDEYTEEISNNVDQLLEIMNQVRKAYNKPMIVASGWRPSAINEGTSNAAKNSNHLKGLAVDIKDTDGSLWKWVLMNLGLMKKLGIYFEDKRWTPTWVHFQIVPPKSKKRIYVPSTAPAKAEDIWDGKYDPKYN